jgi:hypothetical protein
MGRKALLADCFLASGGSIALSWRQYDLFEQMNAGALLQAPMVAALPTRLWPLAMLAAP